MDRDAVNRDVLKLLGRFSTLDTVKLVAESERVDEATILESSGLVAADGRVRIQLIGMMEAVLTLALGQEPTITLPKDDLSHIRDALVLFLKLNHTDTYAYQPGDTPESWAFRLLDRLFTDFADSDILGLQDQLVLRRISESAIWERAFGTALDLYIRAVDEGMDALIRADQPALAATAQTFKTSVKERYDRLPKAKYGVPTNNFRDITDYAIGQYLDGLDVNDALRQTLVQAQLGTQDAEGQARFNAFLKANRITTETFPTTATELHRLVGRSIPFKETEAEIANALFMFAHENGQSEDMRAIFANFTESVLPLAAKCAKLFTFTGLQPSDRPTLIARWMRRSGAMKHVRTMSLADQTAALLVQVHKSEISHLNAFRSGRTKGKALAEAALDGYVAGRIKLLTLNAINQKMTRVADALTDQVNKTERFTAKPGKGMPREVTFGITEFFRGMRSVFEDIFDIADARRRKQLQALEAFTRAHGPLSLVNMLVPRTRGMSLEDWTDTARVRLNEVPYHIFDSD